MKINAKHKAIVQSVTTLYPDKPFALDGQELKWQTETENVLEDITEAEAAAIHDYLTSS